MVAIVSRGAIKMPPKEMIHGFVSRLFKNAHSKEELKTRQGNDNRKREKNKI